MQTEVIPISLGRSQAYLLHGSKSVLVDTGTPGNAPTILALLKSRQIEPQEISLILITHGHSDHMGSAWDLRQATGAPVAIHQADAESIRSGKNPAFSAPNMSARLLSRLIPQDIRKFHTFEPDILIKSEMSLSPYGIEGTVIPTPGHTPGSISVLLDNGDAFVGDLISSSLLRQSRPCFPAFIEDRDQLKKSINLVLSRSPELIFCGHGGPFTPEQLRKLPL